MNPVLQRQGPVNPMNKIDIALALDSKNLIDIALVFDWFISGLAPWSFPYIQGNVRGATPEMNPVLQRQGPKNPINWIDTTLALDSMNQIDIALALDSMNYIKIALALDWFISGLAPQSLLH